MDNQNYLGFRTPFTCLVAGSSQSGKTFFVKKVLERHERLIDRYKQLNVLWCYGIESSDTGKQFRNDSVHITWKSGLPTISDMKGINTIIIDDLLVEASKNDSITNLFTRVSHHMSINMFVLLQNIFYKSPVIRNLNINSNYIVMFRNIRDRTQPKMFARQFSPDDVEHFMDQYEKATSEPNQV